MDAIRDFHVTVKLRNNQLVERRERSGMPRALLADAIGISYAVYSEYENMRRGPFIRGDYELKETAKRICDFYDESPGVLWPDAIRAIQKTEAVRRFNADGLGLLVGDCSREATLSPSDSYDGVEIRRGVLGALRILTDRERGILMRRFGLGGHSPMTLYELGDDEGVSRGRIRQIEAKALRTLRHSGEVRELRAFNDSFAIPEIKKYRYFCVECGRNEFVSTEHHDLAAGKLVDNGWSLLGDDWVCHGCKQELYSNEVLALEKRLKGAESRCRLVE